jgi:pyruvate,orthophosphate dikinase
MDQLTLSKNTVCSLDYLVGTLATAYKGSITSLVAKDFCMTDDGVNTTFRGTILAMPEGVYEASLNRSGAELSRVALKSGSFAFQADSVPIVSARDLQIDIVQTGRHIGTFVLKKENGGGLYISAIELSQDLAGVDLTLLTSPMRDKVGLLQKAEELVSLAHSTKKNWPAFSDKVGGFGRDFFWSDSSAFYRAFGILVRFLLQAAEGAEINDRNKPLSNVIDLLDLPLENEQDRTALRAACVAWLDALSRSPVDLSLQARHLAASLGHVHERFPELGVQGAVQQLISSLRKAAGGLMLLDSRALGMLAALPAGDAEQLSRLGEQGRERMLLFLKEAEGLTIRGDAGSALSLIAGLDFDLLEDRKAIELLFAIANKNVSSRSAGPLAAIIAAFLPSAPKLSARAQELFCATMPDFLDRLIQVDRTDVCADLLSRIDQSRAIIRERIMLTPRLAQAILSSGRENLRMQYRDGLYRITIPSARVRGISPDTWAEIVNPLHLEQLMRFMDLLGAGDGLLESILVRVTANLAVGGVLIPDDQLFQRRISAYLSSPAMKRSFLFNYLLLAQLPVYFHDVGAVSRIRDDSTELDAWGNDPVIYFLRKQVHVNASGNNVRLIESVMRYWVGNDPEVLKHMVPADMLAKMDPGLVARYSTVIISFFRVTGVLDEQGFHPDRVLQLTDRTIDDHLQGGEGGDREARTKVKLLCKLYKEVSRKYSLVSRDAAIGDVHAALLDATAALAHFRSVVMSPEITEPQESLYFKRHIAFGIPSVLGTYHEAKFDALCDMMRRAEDIPVLLQSVISRLEQQSPDEPDQWPERWLTSLSAAWNTLKQYGMENIRIDEFVVVLEQNRLSIPQIVDVLKMWQKELVWLVSSLGRVFHGPLVEIISRFPPEELPEHLIALGPDSPDFTSKAADVVIRDLLSTVPGLIESDRLLNAIIGHLRSRREMITHGGMVPAFPDNRAFYDISALTETDALRLGPALGSKAKNLVFAKNQGLPVPAGVVLPSQTDGIGFPGRKKTDIQEILRQAVGAIEGRTGRTFGGRRDPLFLSVRSGSYPSMPGILNSILYCGMNEDTVQAFIKETNSPVLGWDSYRRFLEHYGTAVLGRSSAFFEDIARELAGGRPPGADHAADLKKLVHLYQERLRSLQLDFPHDVFTQLQHCIAAVYDSWNSERARQFRSATGTSDAWGTSVTLMEMVPGNRDGGGASVFFTRHPDPTTREMKLYGETRDHATGDELASGKALGRPLSRSQGAWGRTSLQESDPEIYRLHEDLAKSVEEAFGGLPQEVEATYLRDKSGIPRIFLLQSRRMVENEVFKDTFDEICRMEARVAGRGIGANGGALSGVASFAERPEQIASLSGSTGMPVILIRKTANTDDISLMPGIKGIITASGGVTSHAAVLAHTFGLAAVVSCGDLTMDPDGQGSPSARIGTLQVHEGTPLSIDGGTGLVFSGTCFPRQGKA